MKENNLPLNGIRILDLTRVLAGPFCTMILADLGAEVIKIEKPGIGDDSRNFPPFVNNESAYYILLNRGKKSIVLNLKHQKGKEIFLELVKKSDVIVENFKPGTMEKLGIGYEVLNKINPKIICASISAFGQYGPYKDRPGYDLISQGMGGIMSITGWPDSPPTKAGTAIADISAALFCCIGILAALRARELTGVGQKIDIAMTDCIVAINEAYNEKYLIKGEIPKRIGNRYEYIYPYDTFKTKDGWVIIGVGNDEIWKRFCKAIGKEELIHDKNFNTNEKRVKNYKLLEPIINEWTSKRNINEIISYLLKYDIPCGPVYTIADACEDPHIAKAREMVISINQPKIGEIKIINCPIKMFPFLPKVKEPAPLLGQHTYKILKELLKLSDEELSKLKNEGVIEYFDY